MRIDRITGSFRSVGPVSVTPISEDRSGPVVCGVEVGVGALTGADGGGSGAGGRGGGVSTGGISRILVGTLTTCSSSITGSGTSLFSGVGAGIA